MSLVAARQGDSCCCCCFSPLVVAVAVGAVVATGQQRQILKDVAVGCLYTSASEPRALRLAAQRAALLTGYGLQLTRRQETDSKYVREPAAAAIAAVVAGGYGA